MTAALYDVAALRAIETQASARSDDASALMRRAGQGAWRVLLDRWPAAGALLVACGPGNNGGDGYVLARHARQSGRDVAVVRVAAHAPRGELAMRACADYLEAGGRVVEFVDGELPPADVVVDALFGIGLARAPDESLSALIAAINRHPAPVFALDVPSGVDAVRGSAPGVSVRAQRTVEFIAPKMSLRTGIARDLCGALQVDTLDLDPAAFDVAASAECLRPSDLWRWLAPRRRDSHKGEHGRVLCVGGEHGHGGAILLAAEAALRSGAGLVDVVTRLPHVVALLARLPEAMAHAHADDADALDAHFIEAADVVMIGPGLGQGAWGATLFDQTLQAGKPAVLDADALNLLAAKPRRLPADTILTPHPGEAARLLGIDTGAVQRDRFDVAQRLAERHDAVVVLKGAGSIVAAPGRTPRLVDAGNPGMAVGGMGDVLAGVIAALRAQGLDAFDAASCGALLHAAAGDAAARESGERGLLPTDLMPWLRRLANPELPT
ncbi:NAD(P)H-hydrate dehydratase [Novilysobacter erysipheiresistens]|uniref:Bifunctional NAD(P)H-hydrate repair enzyme n=1 Tax=Novilysobacter erysipheiresistens TaxID=1749332 RepID=A0ABU7YV48_9GAMM